ncbi:hypothetical protein QYF36_020242 [Acer negundo]|nr:hypothetical protein QYF36_020242 [Acer negundo]
MAGREANAFRLILSSGMRRLKYMGKPKMCWHSLSCFVLLLLLLVLLFPTVALTANISLDTSIFAYEDSSPWRSPSGEFAFGFRKLDENPDHFLLAIWFENVPNKTIVWSANGNDPAWRGSEVKLTNNGALVLNDPQGKESWKRPEDNNSKSSSAAMQDDGNFVLLDGNSKSIWESFKEPTDTILPGQILDMPSHLTSRRTPDNYSDGRFQFHLQGDGNLVLYPISEYTESLYGAYWASGTFVSTNKSHQLVFDKAGYIYMKEAEGTNRIFNLTNMDMGPRKNFYHLARIDYDGVFRQYSYSEEDKCSFSSWGIVVKFPEDICFAITGDVGSGACGYNSYCLQIKGEKKCLCPENYSYVNSQEGEKGCKPNFPLPTCQENGWEANPKLVEFKRLDNTDWPFSDYDLQTGNAVTEQVCEQLCREDCFCAAAIYNGNRCWKKKYPLSNGRSSTSVNRTALLKVPKDGAFGLFEEKKDQSTLILVVSLLLGSSVFLNILMILAIFLAVYMSYHKRKASITVKVDVYSFGVMLLEIICCKSSVAFAMGNQEEEALMDWVYECYKGKKLEKLTENDEEASNDMERVERAVKVALWCIQEDASLRPSMKKVTQMLEGVIEVSVPPYPWNYGSPSSFNVHCQ